jgi:2-keto-4-pentenoate hydratase
MPPPRPSSTHAAAAAASTPSPRARGRAARRRPTRCRTRSPAPSARAALHADTIFETDELPASLFHVIGAEAEIAYRFGRDLPPEAGPYDREAVLAAVATMHPAIEIADTRFAVFGAVDAHSQRADQQNHGVLVLGPGLSDWRGLDPVTQPVRLTVDGKTLHDHVGGNSAVDPVRLLVWLANEGARSLGGIRAGQVVTTGSCTGTDFVTAPTRIAAEFPGLGSVALTIG